MRDRAGVTSCKDLWQNTLRKFSEVIIRAKFGIVPFAENNPYWMTECHVKISGEILPGSVHIQSCTREWLAKWSASELDTLIPNSLFSVQDSKEGERLIFYSLTKLICHSLIDIFWYTLKRVTNKTCHRWYVWSNRVATQRYLRLEVADFMDWVALFSANTRVTTIIIKKPN